MASPAQRQPGATTSPAALDKERPGGGRPVGRVGRIAPAGAERAPAGLAAYSTSSVASIRMGRETFQKFGDVFITVSWISRNCSGVPSPLIRTV